MNKSEIFNRSRLLLADVTMDLMNQKRVIVFGIGGVGSWCVESLVRTGITHITIVDSDCVAITNINRQLMATTATIGLLKTETLRSRLLEINPQAQIEIRTEKFNETTADSFHLDSYDYIIDAIDSLKDKALLINLATRTRAKFFSSMGAALKLDPTRVRVAEFRDVKGCPLARALRQKFKKSDLKPAKKFKCVYSDELLPNLGVTSPLLIEEILPGKVATNGSLMHITAIFGLTLAGLVISDIHNKALESVSSSSVSNPDPEPK